MGTAERRERERLRRQNQILDAAEEVFSRKGFKSATIDEVAESAELSKGTIYLYFKSKEHLLLGIDLRGTRVLTEKFVRASAAADSGLEKTMEIGRAYIEFSQEYPSYFVAMSYKDYLDQDALKDLDDDPLAQQCLSAEQAALGVLVDAIELGKSDGTIRPDLDSWETAIQLWAQSNGAILMHNSVGRHFHEKHGLRENFLLVGFFDFVHRSISNNQNT
jgi:TetR/AcrR family transcriptional regulator